MFNEVLPVAKRNKFDKDYRLILNSLALAYTFQGNFDNALKFHFESLVLREEEGDKQGLSVTLNNIGLVYYKIKNFEKALEYYERSLKVKEEIGDKFDLDVLLINIGISYHQLGNYQESLRFINRALDLCSNSCKDEILVMGKNGLGMSYFGIKDYITAKKYFNESLRIAKNSGSKRFQAENLVFIARIDILNDSLNTVQQWLKEAEIISSEINYVDVRLSVYKHFSEYFIKLNDYKSASAYQSKYVALKDSVYSDQLIKNLATVQNDYEERENLKTIRDKDAILKLKEDLIQRQRAQYFFVIVITVLVFGLAGVLYWANNRQRRSNKELAAAKNRIETINQELESKNADLDNQVRARTEELFMLNQSLQQVNSELDNFIYKTSHDIRGPLATLKGMCTLAIMEIHDPLSLDYIKKIDSTAERLHTILTRLMIVNQINYSALNPDQVDFKHIFHETLELERKKGLPENFIYSTSIDPEVELISDYNLVRIVLENLIDNAVKFYNESSSITPFVKITVSKISGFVTARVEDNGIGINQNDKSKVFQMFMRASERSQTGGVGLYLSKLATEKLGGEIILEDTSEKGTSFFVKFPDDLNIVIAKRAEEERLRELQRQAKEQAKNLQAS